MENNKKKKHPIRKVFFICWVVVAVVIIGFIIEGRDMKETKSTNQLKYWIKVTPTVIDPLHVDVDVQTNIPDGMLSLSVNLANQKPADVFYGTNLIKVQISNGKAKASVDATKNTSPFGVVLPAGDYNVVADFNPGWEENKTISSKNDISEKIEGISIIKFGSQNISSKSTQKMNEGQTWVMDNVPAGMKYDNDFWINKFGNWDELEYKGNSDGRFFKCYYFSSLDMTLVVNTQKNSIVIWRIGKANS